MSSIKRDVPNAKGVVPKAHVLTMSNLLLRYIFFLLAGYHLLPVFFVSTAENATTATEASTTTTTENTTAAAAAAAENVTLMEVELIPCEKTNPVGVLKAMRVGANCTGTCIFSSSAKIGIEIDFDPGVETAVVIPNIFVKIGTIEIPFESNRSDVCTSIHSAQDESCPLKGGTMYTYSRAVSVDSAYPPIPVDLVWQFLSNKNTTVICNKLRVVIEHD